MALQRDSARSSVIEVLDRVLDKGIVIDASIRVAVAGIELVGIDARVVVASVETYLRHADALAFTDLAARPRPKDELPPPERPTLPPPPVGPASPFAKSPHPGRRRAHRRGGDRRSGAERRDASDRRQRMGRRLYNRRRAERPVEVEQRSRPERRSGPRRRALERRLDERRQPDGERRSEDRRVGERRGRR